MLLELTNRIDELENELSDEKEIRIEAENKLEELEFKLAENEAGSGRKTPKVKRGASFRWSWSPYDMDRIGQSLHLRLGIRTK